MCALVSKHLSFCVEEMLAEIDAVLTEHALVKALAQLDQREARGEALDAVCGRALRAKLEREIDQLPLQRMRAKIAELQKLVAEACTGAACAHQTRAAIGATAGVVDLGAYRMQSRATQVHQVTVASLKPKLRLRVQARTSQALALTSMAFVCWASLPPLSFEPPRLRAVEMAAEQVMSLLPFAGRLMAMGGALLG